MNAERWRRLNELFHAAAARAPDERTTFVRDACADDPTLAAEVERLLAAHDRATAFMEAPALEGAASWFEAEEPAAGLRIGPYRVLREIGRGGMGTVFLAERADGQYEQRIAIKLIKRGMDTEQVLERFRAERQILASINHPHIARLLDGGTTADGRPYLAMELIEGEPIQAYADGRQLSVAERLRLFLQVCDAVSHAHGHLIVHRDIKPSNILVTPEGVPKLVDFGIAKLLRDDAGASAPTIQGLRPLTPEYASPEQVKGGPVTTASDVYSLGVVLYELLTGRSPYRPPSRAHLDVTEAIRTAVPAPPSARVEEGRAVLAGTDRPERLHRQLRGDLDTIVLTALRKEPSRRYPSVERFADDIRRHLDGLPVWARPDTFRYRGGKFLRRNRSAVAAGGLVALALFGGTIATAWQARRAREAQVVAERRFAEVRTFANTILFEYHDPISKLVGATPVRERMVRDALGYLDNLASEATGDPALQRELANAYRRVGDVQAGDQTASLGDTDGAIESYEKALGILESLLRADPASARTRRDIAGVTHALVNLTWETGDLDRARAHAARARTLLEALVPMAPDDISLRLELSAAYDLQGQLALEAGDVDQALEIHRADLRWLTSTRDPDHQSQDLRRARLVAHQHLAEAQVEAGQLEEALASYQRAQELASALSAEHTENADYGRLVAVIAYYEGTVLSRMDRHREALERFQRNLAYDSLRVAADPAAVQHRTGMAYTMGQMGEALAGLGAGDSALGYFDRSLQIHDAEFRADSANQYKRLSLIEARFRACKTLVRLGRAEAPTSCARTASLVESTAAVVDPAQAFPRGFLAAAFSGLGEMNDSLAVRRGTAAAEDRHRYRLAAHDMYRRSAEIWADMKARGIVSPADTALVREAEGAAARSRASLGATPSSTE